MNDQPHDLDQDLDRTLASYWRSRASPAERLPECERLLECAESELARTRDQLSKLQAELLTPEVFTRVVEWLREPKPRRAENAFTAGMERQIAYALEMDVLPHVKSMEIRLRNAQAEAQALRQQNQILRQAAEAVVEWLPWHEPDHPEYEGERSDAGRRLRKALWPVRYLNASD